MAMCELKMKKGSREVLPVGEVPAELEEAVKAFREEHAASSKSELDEATVWMFANSDRRGSVTVCFKTHLADIGKTLSYTMLMVLKDGKPQWRNAVYS